MDHLIKDYAIQVHIFAGYSICDLRDCALAIISKLISSHAGILKIVLDVARTATSRKKVTRSAINILCHDTLHLAKATALATLLRSNGENFAALANLLDGPLGTSEVSSRSPPAILPTSNQSHRLDVLGFVDLRYSSTPNRRERLNNH